MRALPAVLLVLLMACKEREAPAAKPATVASAPPVAAIDAAAAAEPDGAAAPAADPLDEKLRHCPLTVEGSTTELRDVEGGVEVIVTAADPAATSDIRRRAAHLVAFSLGQSQGVKHGGGAGGGTMRNCPVVTTSTQITSTAVPGGASLIVKPGPGLTVEALRAETHARHDALAR